MADPTRPPGRPPLHGTPAVETLRLRVTADQARAYRDAARAEGLGVSAWARRYLDRSAARALERSDPSVS